jgi:hypothetical protein
MDLTVPNQSVLITDVQKRSELETQESDLNKMPDSSAAVSSTGSVPSTQYTNQTIDLRPEAALRDLDLDVPNTLLLLSKGGVLPNKRL